MDQAHDGDETRRLVENFRDDAGCVAEDEPESRTGTRPGPQKVAERGQTAVPETQGLPAQLHAVRQARCDVYGLPELRSRH